MYLIIIKTAISCSKKCNLRFYSQQKSLLFVLECNNNYHSYLEMVERVVKQEK